MKERLTPGLLIALGFLTAVGPFASDIYLASFTDVAADLSASAATVQLTLTAFLVGMCTGQFLLGSVSDRFGRRRVLIAALVVFAASGLAAVFSPGIEVFIALRLVQGFSGAGSVVISRAIAVDLSKGAAAVRALSIMAMVGAVAPLIAPPIGGVVADLFGWRGVLAVIAAISTVMLVVAVVVVPESLPVEQRHTGGIGSSFRVMGRLLADRAYLGYVFVAGSSFAGVMAYISASPFVGQRILGMDEVSYSLIFALGAAGLVVGNYANARWAARVGPARMLRLGLALMLGSSVFVLVLVAAGWLSVPTFLAFALVQSLGGGCTLPNASALGLARADAARGTGSALLGSIQFLCGAVASPIVGLWGEDTALPMAVVMLGTSALAIVFAVAAGRARRLDPR